MEKNQQQSRGRLTGIPHSGQKASQNSGTRNWIHVEKPSCVSFFLHFFSASLFTHDLFSFTGCSSSRSAWHSQFLYPCYMSSHVESLIFSLDLLLILKGRDWHDVDQLPTCCPVNPGQAHGLSLHTVWLETHSVDRGNM